VLTQGLIPRVFHGAALVNGKIYVIGGVGRIGNFWKDVQVFDIATGRISEGPEMPRPRSYFATAVVGGRIFVIGGNVGRHDTTDELDSLNLQSGTWTKGASMPAAVVMRGTVVGAHVIIPGGIYEHDTVLTSVLSYDTQNGTWSSLEPLCAPIATSTVEVLDRHLYVFGDYQGSARLIAYDLPSGKSQSVDLDEVAGKHAASVAVGRSIYLIGGSMPSRRRGLASNRIEVFDLNPGWTAASVPPR
jgi:N-acetylneuraminic acid mutarotase